MLADTRRLAFLALCSCVLLLTSLYSVVPFEKPHILRQDVKESSVNVHSFLSELYDAEQSSEISFESILSLVTNQTSEEAIAQSDGSVLELSQQTEKAASTASTTESPIAVDSCAEEPKNNLYFLKTHKTGSSTLQNILVRYAWKKKLLIGLPQGDLIFGSYYAGGKFSKSQMQPLPPGKKPNMLLHHMVFDHEKVSSVLPSDSVYITILRDPATQFESVFKYMVSQVSAFNHADKNGGLKEFVANPTRYFKGNNGLFWWFAKNGVFFDLGYDNLNDTKDYIDKSISEIDDIFDMVLISEYFDISLLLLRDLLCWEMEDMAYLSMNRRNQSTVELVDDVKKDIYAWNKADTALYMHFNETFWKRVEQYGKGRLKRDLEELEKVKKKIADFCVEDVLRSNKDITDITFKMFNPKGIDVVQYKLKEEAKKNESCRGLILPEVEWWKKLTQHQKPTTKRKVVIRRP